MKFNLNYAQSSYKPDTVREVINKLQYLPPRNYLHISRYSTVNRIVTSSEIHINPFMSQAFESSRAKECHETVNHKWPDVSSNYETHVVTSKSENRLDIIAQQYYNNSKLWWVIAKSNIDIMFDPLNVPLGTALRIPNISNLYKSGGVLDA